MAPELPTILFVEDQEATRTLYRNELQEHGFQVLAAIDADEALSLCRRHLGPIHLLLADIALPNNLQFLNGAVPHASLNGLELARLARMWRPHLRVMFISGLSQEEIQEMGGLPDGVPFLQKPLKMDLLVRLARDTAKGVWSNTSPSFSSSF